MKKLFTLLALLTCFIGAKADQLIDKEVDFTKLTDISQMQWYSWGGSGREKFNLDEGCLHFSQDERTGDDWGVQVFPIGGVDAEAGKTYYLEVKIKGTGYQDRGEEEPGSCIHNINMQGPANHDKFNCIEVTEDFTVATIEYECTAEGTYNFLFQCGSWVGDLWIEYMKVYHEGKAPKPRVWENILTNGDAEGEYGDVACAWSKEFGENNNDPHAAPIVDLDGGKVFLSHHNPVDPPILWEEAGEQWGTSHEAGDPKPDNAWQNQFWITLPEPAKEGTQLKVKFRYKASESASADIQTHAMPGDYIGGFTPSVINFGTDWDTFEAEFSAPAAGDAGPFQSIAFNLGKFSSDNLQYEKDINFYFDDLEISTLVLDQGFFVASTDTEDKDPDYDFENAIQFEDAEDGLLAAVVGTEGNEDSWVNEVMISTVRGDDKAFKAAALKLDHAAVNDPEDWNKFTESNGAKIKLPVKGVWRILLDPAEDVDERVMSFEKLEGEEDLVEIEINPNPAELVIDAPEGVTNPWDNQFWVIANQVIPKGEETVLEFDAYIEDGETKVQTQYQKDPRDGSNAYITSNATEDITFTSEEQHFKYTIPINNDEVQSIAFNMGVDGVGAKYHIKNVVWKLSNNTATLIKEKGLNNFLYVLGAGENAGTRQTWGVTGDVNDDDEVGIGDLISVSNFMANGVDSGVTLIWADTNKDNEVGIGDLITISNIMAE